MSEKIKTLFIRYREMIVYLVFGVLTTLVNILVYWPLHNWLSWPAVSANAVAWVVAVLFAFLTNKPFVFRSKDWHPRVLFPELLKFVGCRLASFGFEEVFLAITVDWLSWHGLVMKILAGIAVVIINYVGSKLLVFRKERKNS